jgi:ketosteroid isomerase-like protein
MIDNNISEIQSVVNHWVKSIQHKDMDGILQNHSSDILMFDVPVPLQSKSLKEYRKT